MTSTNIGLIQLYMFEIETDSKEEKQIIQGHLQVCMGQNGNCSLHVTVINIISLWLD